MDVKLPRGETSEISKDHVHHRSLYVAYGEVNDIDLWGEGKQFAEKLFIRTLHKNTVGAVLSRIYADNTWETKDGKVLMTDKQNFRIYNLPEDGTLFDLDLSFIALCW